jgi:hypothetical protein
MQHKEVQAMIDNRLIEPYGNVSYAHARVRALMDDHTLPNQARARLSTAAAALHAVRDLLREVSALEVDPTAAAPSADVRLPVTAPALKRVA